MKALKKFGGWILLTAIIASVGVWLTIKQWRGYGVVQVMFQSQNQLGEIKNPPEGKLVVGSHSLPVANFASGNSLSIRLAAGERYRIIFLHPWLLSQTSAVTVVKGQIHPVSILIKTVPTTLLFDVHPSETILEFDGVRHTVLGSSNKMITLTGLQPDRLHHLTASAPGYRSQSQELMLPTFAPIQTNVLEMERMSADVKISFTFADVNSVDQKWLLEKISNTINLEMGGQTCLGTIGKILQLSNTPPGKYEANITSDDYICEPAKFWIDILDKGVTNCDVIIHPKAAIVRFTGTFEYPLQVADETGNLAANNNDSFLVRPGLRCLRISAAGCKDLYITNTFQPNREHSLPLCMVRLDRQRSSQTNDGDSAVLSDVVKGVVKLVLSRISDDTIVRYVRQFPLSNSLTVNELDYLSKNNVSGNIVSELIASVSHSSNSNAEQNAIKSKIAENWNMQGVQLYQSRQYYDAIQCFDKSLEIFPRSGNIIEYKGNALYRLGQYENAIQCFNNLLEINPQVAHALYGKAISEDALRQHDKAIKDYSRFLKLATRLDANLVVNVHNRLAQLSAQQP